MNSSVFFLVGGGHCLFGIDLKPTPFVEEKTGAKLERMRERSENDGFWSTSSDVGQMFSSGASEAVHSCRDLAHELRSASRAFQSWMLICIEIENGRAKAGQRATSCFRVPRKRHALFFLAHSGHVRSSCSPRLFRPKRSLGNLAMGQTPNRLAPSEHPNPTTKIE